MTFQAFKKRILSVYPDYSVTFERNEAQYHAYIGDAFVFQSDPYSEHIRVFFHGNFTGFLN